MIAFTYLPGRLKPRSIPISGRYYRTLFKMSSKACYPVPNQIFAFLGVHFTRMIDGDSHFGPDTQSSLKQEGYKRANWKLRDFCQSHDLLRLELATRWLWAG